MTELGYDRHVSWRYVLVDETRTVREAFEANPDVELIVRLRPADHETGALGFSEPDAVFDAGRLTLAPRDMPLEQLPAADEVNRVDADLDGEQLTVFDLAECTIGVTPSSVLVSRERAD